MDPEQIVASAVSALGGRAGNDADVMSALMAAGATEDTLPALIQMFRSGGGGAPGPTGGIAPDSLGSLLHQQIVQGGGAPQQQPDEGMLRELLSMAQDSVGTGRFQPPATAGAAAAAKLFEQPEEKQGLLARLLKRGSGG